MTKSSLLYMPYLTLGDPNLEESYKYALALIEGGADILELGIPFSDPIADGPIIQGAMERALQFQEKDKHFTMKRALALCQKIHENTSTIPLALLLYANSILNSYELITPTDEPKETKEIVQHRLEYFLQKCRESGIQNLVIPDLPFDTLEAEILHELSESYKVHQILLVTPNMSEERLKKFAKKAKGWIYYVSSLGVTGLRDALPEDTKNQIMRIRKYTKLPIFAGFGIHKVEQIKLLKGVVDGVIVGSYNQSLIQKQESNLCFQIKNATKDFVTACKT